MSYTSSMFRFESSIVGPICLVVVAAHTEGSAIALAKTLRDAFPKASLALVVAMACDKDHSAFAQALLKGNIIISTSACLYDSRCVL